MNAGFFKNSLDLPLELFVSKNIHFSKGIVTFSDSEGGIVFSIEGVLSVKSLPTRGRFPNSERDPFLLSLRDQTFLIFFPECKSTLRFSFPGEQIVVFHHKLDENSYLFELTDRFVVVDKEGEILNTPVKKDMILGCSYAVSENVTRGGFFAIHCTDYFNVYSIYFFNSSGQLMEEIRKFKLHFMFFRQDKLVLVNWYKVGLYPYAFHLSNLNDDREPPEVIASNRPDINECYLDILAENYYSEGSERFYTDKGIILFTFNDKRELCIKYCIY